MKIRNVLAAASVPLICACAQVGSAQASAAGSSPESDAMEELQAGIDRDFSAMDADGDGGVTKSELRTYAIAMNPGVPVDDVLDLMFADFDADGDGQITKVEYALVAVRQNGAKCTDC